MEINAPDNAQPYLGAAGARPAPSFLARSDRALCWPGTGAPAIVPCWPMPLAAGGVVLGSTRAGRDQRIAGNRTGSYPKFGCITSQGSIFFPHCPCWLILDTRSGATCKRLASQNNYECNHCWTDSWSAYGHILPLTKAETRQFEKKQGETSGKVAVPFPRPSGRHSCSTCSWGVFTLMSGAVACSMAMAASGIPPSASSEQGRGKVPGPAICPHKRG